MRDPTKVNVIRLEQEGYLPSAPNLREHHFKKARRVKTQRRLGYFLVIGSKAEIAQLVARPPVRITLTRVGRCELDDDNVSGAFKAIRDGIAEAIGIDDGDKRLQWQYAQERGPSAVRVEFSHVEAEKAA